MGQPPDILLLSLVTSAFVLSDKVCYRASTESVVTLLALHQRYCEGISGGIRLAFGDVV
jgi:hypothetical protein